ncbi:response regulator [Lachnospiraceae bacterium ZAX-1]
MRNIRIMVVDDEPITRDGVVNGIGWDSYGIEVVGSAENGMEALLMAQEQSPDLIISDVRMPVMDGLEMTERLQTEMPSIKVIIISGYQEFEYAKRAMAFGVRDYLVKPLDEAELVQRILQVGQELALAHKKELAKNLDYLLLSGNAQFARECQRLEKELVVFFKHMQSKEVAKQLLAIFDLFANKKDYKYYKAVCIRQLVAFRDIMEEWGLGKECANIDALVENELDRFTDGKSICTWQTKMAQEFINMARIDSGSKYKMLVQEVEDYVAENYARDVSLKDVSARVFISPQYLCRVFHMEKGASFVEWLNAYRIEKAKDILSTKDARITDVASLVGYNDYKYFSNVFKKHTGVTPRDYKKGQI